MLALSEKQVGMLELAAQARFRRRLDDYVSAQLGTRWTSRPADAREAQIRAGVHRAMALGIEEEVYVAQFTLVQLVRGEAFMREPGAMQITHHATMSWRQKLFQLTALAGIDLAHGAQPAA